jgi:hypothetical protein
MYRIDTSERDIPVPTTTTGRVARDPDDVPPGDVVPDLRRTR